MLQIHGAAALTVCFAAYGWAGWRIARCLPDGAENDGPVRAVAAFIVAASLLCTVVAGLGGYGLLPVRLLTLPSFLIATGLIVGLTLLGTNRSAIAAPRTAPRAVVPAVLLAVVLSAVDTGLALSLAPNDWDAMTYHLFLPSRWLHAATIEHVPTVFGDNAAAYAPQNGALIFAASMLLLNSDAATNALQVLGAGAMAAGVFCLARHLGAGSRSAGMAAVLVFVLEPLRRQVYSADVDAWMAAFFLCALVLLVAYARKGDMPALIVAGLAAGLAAGTKTLGATLVVLVGAATVVLTLRRGRPAHLAVFAIAVMATGGHWYLRNLILYGNPLFPLDFGFGPLHFPGPYGLDAVRAGEFHVDSPGYVLRNAAASFGIAAVLTLLLAAAALVRVVSARRADTGSSFDNILPAALLLFFSVAWSLWFLFGVPHNLEARFLLPAAVAVLPGVALPLDRLFRSNPLAGWLVGVVGILLVASASDPVERWRDLVDTLAAAGVSWRLLLLLTVLSPLAWLAAWLLHRRGPTRGRLLIAVSLAAAVTVGFIALATEANEDSRLERFKRSDFSEWTAVVGILHDPAAAPATVAYSGVNLPYILTGRRLRHWVHYLNVAGQPGDGFHEHWTRGGRLHFDYHKPGLERSDVAEHAWLVDVERVKPSFVAVFTLHPFERRYLAHDEDGYPVELQWLRARPEQFEVVAESPSGVLFRRVEPALR